MTKAYRNIKQSKEVESIICNGLRRLSLLLTEGETRAMSDRAV
jgi:hypothetical protein